MLAISTPLRRAAAAALAAGALLTVGGCALFGPQQMSIEDAGERYLNIVCTSNAAGDRAYDLLDAGLAELDAGGSPDVSAFNAAAAEARDVVQRSASLLGSDDVLWPTAVAEDIAKVQRSLLIEVSDWEGVRSSASIEEAGDFILSPEPVELEGAAQAVRAGLNISADTEASCVGRENGHDALTD